jgi:hypothetical protein
MEAAKCPLALKAPSTGLIFGCSGSGKSELVAKILRNIAYCYELPTRSIHVCYAVYQPLYAQLAEDLPNISFHNSLPTMDLIHSLRSPLHHDIIIIDDWARESAESRLISDIYSRYSHHFQISCLQLVQNLFVSGSQRRMQSTNAHYTFFMKNPCAADQIATFARQRHPKRSKLFLDAYREVTAQPWSYLLNDSHPRSDPSYAIRTGLFPGDELLVYQFP